MAVPSRNEQYSVSYFDCVSAFQLATHLHSAFEPALNGSSEISRFQRGDAIEIRNGITFVFYPGLPHVVHVYMSTMCWLHYSAHSHLPSYLGWALDGKSESGGMPIIMVVDVALQCCSYTSAGCMWVQNHTLKSLLLLCPTLNASFSTSILLVLENSHRNLAEALQRYYT